MKTETFDSSSEERTMSFPLTPQAPTMHAFKCMIGLFDRFYSLIFVTPLPQLQLRNSAHHSSHPICLVISRGTSSEDGNFRRCILSFVQMLCHPCIHFLLYPQAKYSCVKTDSSRLPACPLFLLPYSQTTALPALLHHPVSLSIWCGPELCLRYFSVLSRHFYL